MPLDHQKPQIHRFSRRRPLPETCGRGHAMSGFNVLPSRACRACNCAHAYARRHNMFTDHPDIIARADAAFAQYLEDGRV